VVKAHEIMEKFVGDSIGNYEQPIVMTERNYEKAHGREWNDFKDMGISELHWLREIKKDA
jgi:hypothetical protein